MTYTLDPAAGFSKSRIYDNRQKIAYENTRAELTALGQPGLAKRTLHLQFTALDKTVVYCYIRKNACSAFKKMLCDSSEFRQHRLALQTDLKFLLQYHSVSARGDISNVDHRIFVYRDPITRIVALFINKFIVRSSNSDIFLNYKSVMKKDPGEVTFRDFVYHYLGQTQTILDPHCLSQCRHLWPVFYTEAIPIERLYFETALLFGHEFANKHFKLKVNSTIGNEFTEPAWNVPSVDLHHRYRRIGEIPSAASLVSDPIRQRLREIYADDFMMIAGLVGGGAGQ